MTTKVQARSAHALYCKDKLRAYQKVKNFKGHQTLRWEMDRTPLKTDVKCLQSINLEDYTFWDKNSKFHVGSNLLKHAKCLRRLSLNCMIKDEQALKQTFKTLRKLKTLISLEIKGIDSFKIMNDKNLGWIEKILKLFPKLENFTYLGLEPRHQKEAIERTFRVFQKMPNLSRVCLRILLTPQFLHAILPALHSLITANPKIIFQPLLWFEGWSYQSFKSLFSLLQNVGPLKELFVKFSPLYGNFACEELILFLEKNPQLEVLSFQGILQPGTSFTLPLSQLTSLRKLTLNFEYSTGINKENFPILAESISGCSNLKELSLNIARCSKFEDECILSLENTLSGLQSLETLELKIGGPFQTMAHLSSQSFDSISKMPLQLKRLKRLDFNMASFSQIKDESVQALLESISQLPELKELKMNFSETYLTDEAFLGLSQVFERLTQIESCYFNFWKCKNIKGQFLDNFPKGILDRKELPEKWAYLSFDFYKTGIKCKEPIDFS